MVLSCLGFKPSPRNDKASVLPDNARQVLFAGWASFVIQDVDNQPRIYGEFSPEESELVRVLTIEHGDSFQNLNAKSKLKLFGWEALRGFLAPNGAVFGIQHGPLSSYSQAVVRLYYPNASDVVVCGYSMDHLTVVIDSLTGQLYQWTASDTTPRPVIPCSMSESGPMLASTVASTLLLKTVKFERLWAGEGHVLALATDGTLYSWGTGRHGQLGHGSLASEPMPKPIEYLQGIRIVDAACGAAFSVALSEAGDIYTFGLNDHGQLGTGRYTAEPDAPKRNTAYPQIVDFYIGDQDSDPIDVNVSKIACGRAHTVVLDDQGHAWSCGWGKYGQLGNQRATSTLQPREQKQELHEQGVQELLEQMLGSTGCIVAQADRFHFSKVEATPTEQPWRGVTCGQWGSFLWTAEQ
ncbi:regulator of chromosome condensation 1/beta-lactamase-inhibitor protein II [Mortierella sp. GBAus27b]|nr:regulator of chromosome condensation 1/beta-lactamase-inhibitor protein II [Mortierella sp. GBAus27b]